MGNPTRVVRPKARKLYMVMFIQLEKAFFGNLMV